MLEACYEARAVAYRLGAVPDAESRFNRARLRGGNADARALQTGDVIEYQPRARLRCRHRLRLIADAFGYQACVGKGEVNALLGGPVCVSQAGDVVERNSLVGIQGQIRDSDADLG